MEQSKAEVGKISRKFFGNDAITTKSAAGNYRVLMTEAKSLMELPDGEIVDEEEYKQLAEILTCLVELLHVIKANI